MNIQKASNTLNFYTVERAKEFVFPDTKSSYKVIDVTVVLDIGTRINKLTNGTECRFQKETHNIQSANLTTVTSAIGKGCSSNKSPLSVEFHNL